MDLVKEVMGIKDRIDHPTFFNCWLPKEVVSVAHRKMPLMGKRQQMVQDSNTSHRHRVSNHVPGRMENAYSHYSHNWFRK